jgi:hypothetical protein
MLPGTADGMTHVCYFRHALALDEWRVKFFPEYTYGGSAKPLEETDQCRGMRAVIQLAICADPKLVQSPRERFHKQRRFGFQGHTQTCMFILIHNSVTNVQHVVAVEM